VKVRIYGSGFLNNSHKFSHKGQYTLVLSEVYSRMVGVAMVSYHV